MHASTILLRFQGLVYVEWKGVVVVWVVVYAIGLCLPFDLEEERRRNSSWASVREMREEGERGTLTLCRLHTHTITKDTRTT